ncbi:unnamed protein product [Pleuronectes platessa]|uniref:C3H1-type domain-containing protein n=1 Tax=Pleuronectes platessa TaxID=8262 RepID=A0A9N7VA86_PLEPL|nr:unnamed protein product [Pleuronectes platessa]
MAFANLFTGLSMDQDVTHSGAGERKRRSQAELRGPDNKKQGYEAQSSWTYKPKPFKDDDSTEHSRTGFSKDLMHNHSDNSGHNNMHHKDQNAKKNYKQQQQNNQMDGRKHQHHQKDRGGFSNGGGHYQTRFTSRKFGGQGKRQDAKQEFKVPTTRVMTQEFREQNALLVDGQLLCRHFIWGRCIKGDKCQLKHIQGSNDIIKEVCKKGKCSHGVDCNFSHDPLNETTSRLLEEVLKQDKDLYELSKIEEQKSSGQPANTDETEITESKKTPDVLTQPLRPIFYNSGEPKTEKEALLSKQPTETHEPSKQLQLILEPGTQQPNSSEATAECSSNIEHCGDSSFGRSKTFCSLFASPITDSQKLTPDFGTASSSLQSSCSALLSAHSRSEDYHVKTVAEPDQVFARSFLGLFSAPLSAAPLPCKETQTDYSRTASCTQESNQLSDKVTHSSDSNQRASKSETPLPGLVKTSHRPASPKSSPTLKNENDLSEAVSQPTKQQVNPACREISSSRTPCGDRAGSSTTQTHHHLPDISSPKVGATSNSVLKTLFLCLSPFEEGGEKRHSAHISLPSESVQKDQSSMGDVFVQQQQKRKKKRRKKKTPYSQQQSTEKSVAHSTEHQPSSQTSLFSVEATARSTFSAPARTEPQVRNSGTHNSPFRPVTQLTQHHVRPSLKNNSEEGKWGKGKESVTPFKDLFKTLDTNVFNLGH